MSEPTVDLTVQPQLCLDTADCDTDHMIIWLLHHMWRHDTDYTMMPPALQSSLEVPWDLCMKEYLKLWRNSTYITWKTSFPSEEDGIAMTFISTNHREFDSGQLVIDISDGTAIRYLASKVDDKDGDGDESTGNAAEDDDTEDEDDLDEDLHRTMTDIANKTDDSGFSSGAEDNPKIKPLSGPGTTWTGKVPSYSLRVLTVSYSTQSNTHMASHSGAVWG